MCVPALLLRAATHQGDFLSDVGSGVGSVAAELGRVQAGAGELLQGVAQKAGDAIQSGKLVSLPCLLSAAACLLCVCVCACVCVPVWALTWRCVSLLGCSGCRVCCVQGQQTRAQQLT
jgi:hypothetical protein